MRRYLRWRRTPVLATLAVVTASSTALAVADGQAFAGPSVARPAGPSVLLVCNGSGTKPCPHTTASQFTTIQDAVNAAKPGDWILIWPGVYHENDFPAWRAGVYVTTPDLHIRGLNRNQVIISGSQAGAPAACPRGAAWQNWGPPNDPASSSQTTGTGWDGLVVAATGVSVQNLTVCNYLSGIQGHGNEIWFNFGDGSGIVPAHSSYRASYLSATAEYAPTLASINPNNNYNFGQYGIFTSNSGGPGSITHSYASNMADAAYYIGACQRVCDQVMSHDVGTNSSLGYSGTNAGGNLVIKHSVFRGNRDGIVPNSLNNDDAPPPQNGRCAHSTRLCFTIEHNLIINNNNPNTPVSGLVGPVGTGIELSGGSYDTVKFNTIVNQGSWGILANDYPDFETPPPASHCQGGFPNVSSVLGTIPCDFPARGNRVYGNAFVHVGFFGNKSNSDLATIGLLAKSAKPRNCFYANRAYRSVRAFRLGHRTSLTSAPAHIQLPSKDGPSCGRPGTWQEPALLGQLLWLAYHLGSGDHDYPVYTGLKIVPLPRLKSMPRPCSGVPANEFCY